MTTPELPKEDEFTVDDCCAECPEPKRCVQLGGCEQEGDLEVEGEDEEEADE